MFPFVKNNDYVLTTNLYSLKKGDVVVINADELGLVIKRILSTNKEKIYLIGDNRNTDSSVYGVGYSFSKVVGKVIFKFSISISLLNKIIALPSKFLFFLNTPKKK